MNLIAFGRRRCSACQELKRQLILAGHPFTYYCLDPPDCEFNAGDAHSIAEWGRARTAMTQAATYSVIATTRLPILLRVHGEPCEHPEAFERVEVLNADGQIELLSIS